MMITRHLIKTEIDKVHEKYLVTLYRIVHSFTSSSGTRPHTKADRERASKRKEAAEWHTFIQKTYGCLADYPIERGEQGKYELRMGIE